MHFPNPFLFLSPLAAILLFSVSAAVSLPVELAPRPRAASHWHNGTHDPPPHFKSVFAGYFDIASQHSAAGPFGSRLHNAMSGGSMWDAATGAAVADILPFADDGVSTGTGSAAGPFFPVALIPLVWAADGHYAAFSTIGVSGGSSERAWEYAHVETDSPTYAWMNSEFFILRVNSSAIPHLTFTMYQETS